MESNTLSKWIKKNFYSTMYGCSDMKGSQCLYIDLGSFFDICIGDDLLAPFNMEYNFQVFRQNVEELIMDVTYYAGPVTLLFISVDGALPVAEARKKNSEWLVNSKEDISKKVLYVSGEDVQGELDQVNDVRYKLNPSSFLMSTKDSLRIDKALKTFIKERYFSQDFNNLTVIYEGYLVPGTSKSKILNHLSMSSNLKNMTHAICSSDVNMVLAGLTFSDFTIDIFRLYRDFSKDDTPEDRKKFIIPDGQFFQKLVAINGKKMYDGLIEKFKKNKNHSSEINYNRDGIYLVKDFTLLCISMGGDYMPPPPGYEAMANLGGIDKMIDHYVEFINSSKGNFISNKSKFGDKVKALISYFKVCAKHQNILLEAKKEEIIKDETIDQKDAYYLVTKEEQDLYYTNNLNFNSLEDRATLCGRYVNSMIWIANNYIDHKNNGADDFYYSHNYSPLMSDLASLNSAMVSKYFSRIVKFTGYGYVEQLLCAPSACANILPLPLREYYFNDEKIAINDKTEKFTSYDFIKQFISRKNKALSYFEYYNFIDTKRGTNMFRKVYENKNVFLLPVINLRGVENFYHSRKRQLSPEELDRDKTEDEDDCLLYVWDMPARLEIYNVENMPGVFEIKTKGFSGVVYSILGPDYLSHHTEFTNKVLTFYYPKVNKFC